MNSVKSLLFPAPYILSYFIIRYKIGIIEISLLEN